MRLRIFLSILTIIIASSCLYAKETSAKKIVLTSFYPVYIMAINVTKDVPGIAVVNLTSNFTGCLHDYALTTSEMRKISKADIFICNGGGMESFLINVSKQYPKLKIAELSDRVEVIKENNVENAHFWLSISNAIIQVDNLAKAMQNFDSSHSELYNSNAVTYISKLKKLQDKMKTHLSSYKGVKVITFHEAFPYFAKEFGLEIAAVVEREPGASPNAEELADTIKIIRKNKIRAIFTEPQYPVLSASIIAKETGVKVYSLDPVVTGPDEPEAYLKIMERNLETLEEAFQ